MAKIYIADDNSDVRNVVYYALMVEGHDVSQFRDGEAAFEALLSDPPELLILDIMMPGMDGFEVLQNMSSWGLLSSIGVLVLSAKAASEDRDRALELGAHAFMSKPFDPDHMLETIDRLLAGRDDDRPALNDGGSPISDPSTVPILTELQSLLGDF